jgi:hypothetical protein
MNKDRHCKNQERNTEKTECKHTHKSKQRTFLGGKRFTMSNADKVNAREEGMFFHMDDAKDCTPLECVRDLKPQQQVSNRHVTAYNATFLE